jgi:hypothetical protein
MRFFILTGPSAFVLSVFKGSRELAAWIKLAEAATFVTLEDAVPGTVADEFVVKPKLRFTCSVGVQQSLSTQVIDKIMNKRGEKFIKHTTTTYAKQLKTLFKIHHWDMEKILEGFSPAHRAPLSPWDIGYCPISQSVKHLLFLINPTLPKLLCISNLL